MKYLGIDYGTKRLGTAISDKLGMIATSYQLLANDQNLMANLTKIIESEQIEAIVLGLPKHMHNELSVTSNAVLALKDELQVFNIPIFLQDERRSTAEAKRILISADVSRAKRKQKIDNLAATIILQTYLDACKKI